MLCLLRNFLRLQFPFLKQRQQLLLSAQRGAESTEGLGVSSLRLQSQPCMEKSLVPRAGCRLRCQISPRACTNLRGLLPKLCATPGRIAAWDNTAPWL